MFDGGFCWVGGVVFVVWDFGVLVGVGVWLWVFGGWGLVGLLFGYVFRGKFLLAFTT
ncbi:hypothetical protein RA278_27615 [Pseudomonas syringae pv. tagetis]